MMYILVGARSSRPQPERSLLGARSSRPQLARAPRWLLWCVLLCTVHLLAPVPLAAQTPPFDSAQIQALIARGDYDAAMRELEIMQDQATAFDTPLITALLERAQSGQQAIRLANEARTALEQNNYPAAKAAALQAQPTLTNLGQPEQAAVVGQYIRLADDGLYAQQQLDLGRRTLLTLRVGAARTLLNDAYASFTRLDDQAGAEATQRLLSAIIWVRWGLASSLVLLAALVAGWNIRRRLFLRAPAVPFG